MRSINVLMKDHSAVRLPRDRAEELLDQGKAIRFISNTIYKAVNCGIAYKDIRNTRDDRAIKAQIIALKEKAQAAEQAAEKKRKREAREKAG